MAARQEISDKAWAVMAPHFPVWKGNGRPIMDMRRTVEGIVWRLRNRQVQRRNDVQNPPCHGRQGTTAEPGLTAGQAADTSFFQTVLETISVAGNSRGRPRMRPDRVLADKACTSSANRGYLAGRGIKVTIPERSDQIAGRARRGSKGGRPRRSFDKEAYKGRNVLERCFNRLKQWRGIATRSDKTARSYLAGVTLASALIRIKSGV